jgi:hypothetical protein
MRITLPLVAMLATCIVAPAAAQIGTLVPDARLPIVTSSPRVVEWQSAGYFKHVANPIVYTLVIDVTTLGAVGDGTANSTSAFTAAVSQAATESANGGFTIISVPAGTYRITSPIALTNNMVLKGAGSNSTTIHFELTTGNGFNINSRTNTGIEDVKLTMATGNNKNGFTGNLISFNNTQYGYVRGVHTFRPARNHMRLVNSRYIEVRDSYLEEGQDVGGGGNGYGVEMDSGTKWSLVENNSFRKMRHSMILQTDCHFNVFGYNYSNEGIRSETPTDWASDIALHGSWDANRGGPYLNLFEGNRVRFIMADDSHGANGNFNLFFRNEGNYLGLRIANTTSNQTMVNNYLRCSIFTYQLLGYPWVVGGSGHWFKNNRTIKGSSTTWRDSQNATYLNDASYYHTAKPTFFGAKTWPHEPFAHTNPAEDRGYSTIKAGWSGYVPAP